MNEVKHTFTDAELIELVENAFNNGFHTADDGIVSGCRERAAAAFLDSHTRANLYELLRSKQPPSGETVRVRIAVAVSAEGLWSCAGESLRNDDALISEIQNPGDRITFVEANCPLPVAAQTIEGTVTE